MRERSKIYGIDYDGVIDLRKVHIPIRKRREFIEKLYFDFKIEFVVKPDRVICHCVEQQPPLGGYRYEATKGDAHSQLSECLRHVIQTITKNVSIQGTTAA